MSELETAITAYTATMGFVLPFFNWVINVSNKTLVDEKVFASNNQSKRNTGFAQGISHSILGKV